MTNSRLTDPEVLEWRYPVLLESFEIRRGSGGAGLHKGGDGVAPVAVPARYGGSDSGQPPDCAAYGMDGGDPGAPGRNWVERTDGTIDEFGATDIRQMAVGDVFVIETPGGGGFGKKPR